MTIEGKRDDGTDAPSGGPTDRPAGTVDEDKNPPLSDPEDDTEYGAPEPFRRKTPSPPSHRTRAARQVRSPPQKVRKAA